MTLSYRVMVVIHPSREVRLNIEAAKFTDQPVRHHMMWLLTELDVLSDLLSMLYLAADKVPAAKRPLFDQIVARYETDRASAVRRYDELQMVQAMHEDDLFFNLDLESNEHKRSPYEDRLAALHH